MGHLDKVFGRTDGNFTHRRLLGAGLSYDYVGTEYPGCQRFFLSLGATELSGEAAKKSREAARKKPLAPIDNNLTSMPTPVSFD